MKSRNRILLASDLTEASGRVAAEAVRMARTIGATVVSIHVVTEEAMAEAVAELPEDQAFVDVVVSHVAQNLSEQAMGAAEDQDVHVDVKVVEGQPEVEILEEFERGNYDYAVIGVRNRSRVGKLLLGSVAQEVLLGAHKPIVAVPTEI